MINLFDNVIDEDVLATLSIAELTLLNSILDKVGSNE
jgi:hypothetical protein